MPDVLRPHTSQENSQTAMHTWKSVALVIFDTLFTLQPNTSVTGILFLLNTLPKSKLKASTTMLPYLMPQRNSYDLFTLCRSPVKHILPSLDFLQSLS